MNKCNSELGDSRETKANLKNNKDGQTDRQLFEFAKQKAEILKCRNVRNI